MTTDRRRLDPTAGRPIHQVRPDGRIVGEIRADTPVFVISVAADLAGMHAQTLRSYDREGLVSPRRTSGGGRRYSQRDIELLQQASPDSADPRDIGVHVRPLIHLVRGDQDLRQPGMRAEQLVEDEDVALEPCRARGLLIAVDPQIIRQARIGREPCPVES